MKVTFAGTTYDCVKAVRDDYRATLYLNDEDGSIVEHIGVSDWSAYRIEGGEWSAYEPTQTERMEAQATYTAMMTDTLLEED